MSSTRRLAEELQRGWLPGLADGSALGGVALAADITVTGGKAAGTAPAVLGGGLATVLVLPAGDDVIVRRRRRAGVTVERPHNLDPTRRGGPGHARGRAAQTSSRTGAGPGRPGPSAHRAPRPSAWPRECTEQAAAYAKVRLQFGRPIAMFQAVKHHCANMLVAAELATADVWDAARAAERAATNSPTAPPWRPCWRSRRPTCANLNIQVHGGIGFTWEHDAHLYLRRATALEAMVDTEAAATTSPSWRAGGEARPRTIDLPPEAEPIRDEVRVFAEQVKDLDAVGDGGRP